MRAALLFRRYGVPAAMVDEATRRRLAGDWRGACAAARIDVDLDLDLIRDRHGVEVAQRLTNDLAHLAPDLLRWHLLGMRTNWRGEVTPNCQFILASYGPRCVLQAATPTTRRRPHRIVLSCREEPPSGNRTTDWRGMRFLWDTRETHRLADHALPDRELLRSRLMEPHELHPLVRAALLPDQPDPGYRPWIGHPPASRRPTRPDREIWFGEDIPVRCRGTWHHVGIRGNGFIALNHSEEELARERVMGALGGAVIPCLTVQDTWLRRDRPERFGRRLRRHVHLAVRHGRADELLRLLDAGLEPVGLGDGDGRTLLHHLALLDEAARLVLPRLVEAGLDINQRDHTGRTPLDRAREDGGRPELLAVMVEAGAVGRKTEVEPPRQPRRIAERRT